MKGSGRLFLPR